MIYLFPWLYDLLTLSDDDTSIFIVLIIHSADDFYFWFISFLIDLILYSKVLSYQFAYGVHDEVGGYHCDNFHATMVNNKSEYFGCFC